MKASKLTFAVLPSLIGLSVAALIAWGVDRFSSFGFWPAFSIVIVAIVINGLVMDVEDNEPGGFNYPLPPDKSGAPEARRDSPPPELP